MEQVKQTAVEWLANQIKWNWHDIEFGEISMSNLVEQAKAMENKTDIQELIDRNYAAQIKRGQITPDTDLSDCIDKIKEELKELVDSYIETNKDFDSKELIDIMLVCFSMAKHFGIDWKQVMTDKVEFNEKRLD